MKSNVGFLREDPLQWHLLPQASSSLLLRDPLPLFPSPTPGTSKIASSLQPRCPLLLPGCGVGSSTSCVLRDALPTLGLHPSSRLSLGRPLGLGACHLGICRAQSYAVCGPSYELLLLNRSFWTCSVGVRESLFRVLVPALPAHSVVLHFIICCSHP